MITSQASGFLVDKGNHRHFMLKEIHEQPEVISHTLTNYIDMAAGRVRFPDLGIDLAKVTRVTISACGTAYYAGLVAKYWLERYARVPVEIDVASELRYREAPLPEGGLAVFVSQSGETADTLATLRYCKANGQRIASVVNVRTSTIARESHAMLPTLAGPEIGVASTKAFTCQLSTLACLALAMARARGTIGAEKERELVRALTEVPRHISTLLRDERRYEELAHWLVEGRGRALSRPRHVLPDRARGRPEAEGDLLHPRRGLCRRRDEARADRADRRERAGRRRGARGRSLREDGLQHAGGGGARRPDRASSRMPTPMRPAARWRRTCGCRPCIRS